MDSGNSVSMQSSSSGGRGDEEYDSLVESSLSAFLNNDSSLLSSSLPLPRHVNVSRFTSTANNEDDNHILEYPLSNYMDPMQRSHQNFDMVWSKTGRSEPNQSNLVGLIPSSIASSSNNQQQGFLSGQIRGVGVGVGVATFPTTHHSSMPLPQESASRGLLVSEDQRHNYNKSNNSNMVRNPKKRSRASRRAPTTVLTTNTTNFRAMVQEFTGIPAPPFTSSPFQRTRLDLFGSSSAIRSLDTPQPSQPQQPYLLRPFAQKLHPSFPLASSTSSIPMSMLDNNNTLLGHSNHSSNNLSTNPTQFMMNMHNNPILSIESILQGQQVPQNSKYPLGNSSNTSVDNSHLKMSVLEELGLSHAHLNNIASSSSGAALSSRVHNNNNNNNLGDPSSSSNWVQRTGTTITSNNNNGGDDNDDDHGNYTNNIHHGEKGPECGVAARSEGMVESWINCSSSD